MADLFDERVRAVIRSERSRAELALLLVRCHEERLMPVKARSRTIMREAIENGLGGYFFNDLRDQLLAEDPSFGIEMTDDLVERLKDKAAERIMNAIDEQFTVSDGDA